MEAVIAQRIVITALAETLERKQEEIAKQKEEYQHLRKDWQRLLDERDKKWEEFDKMKAKLDTMTKELHAFALVIGDDGHISFPNSAIITYNPDQLQANEQSTAAADTSEDQPDDGGTSKKLQLCYALANEKGLRITNGYTSLIDGNTFYHYLVTKGDETVKKFKSKDYDQAVDYLYEYLKSY